MDLAEAVSPEQSGTRLAELDSLANSLKTTQILSGLNELALAPAKARSYNATARLHEIQAQTAENELQQGRNFAQGLQGANSPEDVIERIEQFAGTLPPAKGLKLLEGVANVRARNASADLSGAREELQRARRNIAILDQVGGLYRNADTPEAWQRAHELVKQTLGEDSPYANVPFQPGIGTVLSKATLKEKDRQQLEFDRRRTEATERTQTARNRQIDSQLRVLNAREKILNDTYERVKRNDGERSPAALKTQQERKRLLKERADLVSLRNRGSFPENPITSIPARGEVLPGRWYKLPQGPMRWHPNGNFYGPNEPFPPLPATTGAAGTGARLSSNLQSILNFLKPDSLEDADLGDD